MRIRDVLLVSFGMKAGIVLLCFSMLYAHKMLGKGYFNVIIPPAKQRQEVRNTFNRNVRDDLGLTGFMFAAINGELALTEALFEYGANLNLQSPKEQQTALHYATNNMRSLGSQQVGYALVDFYADTRKRNIFGQTPLHLVISTDTLSNRTKMVEYLLKNGSDMNAQTNQGDTLMHLAVNLKNSDWVETLLEQWATIIDMRIKNKKGLTPFGYAEQLGYGSLAKILAKPYPTITKASGRDKNGLTGLMLAIMGNKPKRFKAMAKKKKALNLLSDDSYRNSALHIALLYQNLPAVTALIENGADRMIKNGRGEIPLHYLVRVWDIKKKQKIAPLLLTQLPESILAQTDQGDTIIHYIVQFNDTALLNFLVKKYKDMVKQVLAIKNKSLQSPLALAKKLNRTRLKSRFVRLMK